MSDRIVQSALAALDGPPIVDPFGASSTERVDGGAEPWLSAACRGESGWRLESAARHPATGRFCFAGADPYAELRVTGTDLRLRVRRAVRPDWPDHDFLRQGDPLGGIRRLCPPPPRRPACAEGWPFAGGAVGYLGYELASAREPGRPRCLAAHGPDGLPDAVLLFVDRLVAYDREAGRLRFFALGFDADDLEVASRRAEEVVREYAAEVERRVAEAGRGAVTRARRASRPDMSMMSRTGLPSALEASEDAGSYAKAVEKIGEEIAAGNVYQANFSQRLSVPCRHDVWSVYAAVRHANPAPFAAALALPEAGIVSSSPERFLHADAAGRLETRPIKGTRPRGRGPEEDAALEAELAASLKDRAENLMIVDLMRNDLGRVSRTGSVRVPQLMAVEAYASVFHLVSSVEGRLADGFDAIDAVAAAFPPGSMTGAPKLAAIECLAALEHERRGVYSGALGYLDVRGGLDLSVVIRTVVLKGGFAHLRVGGGVVADSVPAAEYKESLDKARALLFALAELERT